MNVSPDFSPPLRLIAPYFVIATLFYTVSMGMLFGLNPSMSIHDFRVVGWVHTYMIGFVMMVMIGAMGQLSVVIAEVHHKHKNIFGWIWPLLSIGTVVLVNGFYTQALFLVVGGGLILLALGLFALNLFITLMGARRKTDVTGAMKWSNLFLLAGLFIGLLMALGYAGVLETNPSRLVTGHVFAIFGGYVLLSIMGVSTVLLPMFGACKRPSDNEYRISFYAMALSAALGVVSILVEQEGLRGAALLIAVGALGYYVFSMVRLFTSKPRHYADIWERSVAVAVIMLILSMGLGVSGYFMENERWVMMGFWLLTAGFFGFLISGHLYKIVPFLVWFERFAPYIDERDVPMLHQLLPEKWAKVQWLLALCGVTIGTAAIGFENTPLLYVGSLFMIVSGGVLMGIVFKVLRYR